MAVKFTVKFKGEDLGTFDSDVEEVDHLITLEAETGMSVDEMIKALGRSSGRGMQAIVWYMHLKANKPQPLHVNFKLGDLDIEPVKEAEEDADPSPAADPVAALEEAFKKPATNGSAR